jgi:ComEC/Rec2-related protein
MIASIVALLAYARFVGDGASVDRATLMALVYFGARAFDHRSPPLNALAVVAGVLVVTDPLSVADPAFLLTFGATLGILVVVPVVTAWNAKPAKDAKKSNGFAISAISAFKRSLWSMFAASAAAEALLFPVGAIVFSRVTFAGLALNFLAIPMMAVAQIAGMAVVPAAILSARGAAALGWIAHLGAVGLVRSQTAPAGAGAHLSSRPAVLDRRRALLQRGRGVLDAVAAHGDARDQRECARRRSSVGARGRRCGRRRGVMDPRSAAHARRRVRRRHVASFLDVDERLIFDFSTARRCWSTPAASHRHPPSTSAIASSRR